MPHLIEKKIQGDREDHDLYEYAMELAQHDSDQNETRQVQQGYPDHLLEYPNPAVQRRNRRHRDTHVRVVVPD